MRREIGFPQNPNHSGEIAEKLWGDLSGGRMFICSACAVGNNPEVLPAPSTLVSNRLPGRTMSDGESRIADLRAVNMVATKGNYLKMTVPRIQILAKRVGILKRSYPWETITGTKRDIDSDCRRVNLRPAASIIMNTELVGRELGL